MSLYAEYVRERENKHILEDDKGFITYVVNGDECYIVDMYIKEKHRRSGHGIKQADQVCEAAKRLGCKYITGSVDPRTNGATYSMKLLINYGMEVLMVKDSLVYFVKELK